jgi:hypothetical protein
MVTIIKKGTSGKEIRIALRKRALKHKGPDLRKYCGCIRLDIDAVLIQKDMRNEWE